MTWYRSLEKELGWSDKFAVLGATEPDADVGDVLGSATAEGDSLCDWIGQVEDTGFGESG